MATTKKKTRKYKTPKVVLGKMLEFFSANADNWTSGRLHKKRETADGGYAHCAIGAALHFAEGQKIGNTAIRYLAEGMGMENAQKAPLGRVKEYIIELNDSDLNDGRKAVMSGLKKAMA